MNVKVTNSATDPIPTEIIAEHIASIAGAMKKIDQGRLTRNSLIILIWSRTGVPKKSIESILACLSDLERLFLKPKRSP